MDNVRRASWLALLAGGDFIKTSTGKVTPAATPPVALVMLEAVRDFADSTGELCRASAAERVSRGIRQDAVHLRAPQRDRSQVFGAPLV